WDTLVGKGGPRNVTTGLRRTGRSGDFAGPSPLPAVTAMPAVSPRLPNCVMNVDRKRSFITGYSSRSSWGSTTLRKPYVGRWASLPDRLPYTGAPKGRQHRTTGLLAGPDVRWAVMSGE